MKYYGKRYLYNFLKKCGYTLPKMNELVYSRYCGSEWIKSEPLAFDSAKVAIEAYVNGNQRGVIRVTLCQLDMSGCPHEIEYSKFINGALDYQELNHKIVIINGQYYRY